MSDTDTLPAAFDHAIGQVDRALAAGMRTLSGEDAASRLKQLRADLAAQRAAACRRGHVDPEWIRGTVRSVAEWAPQTDVSLLAALGALARLRADVPAG